MTSHLRIIDLLAGQFPFPPWIHILPHDIVLRTRILIVDRVKSLHEGIHAIVLWRSPPVVPCQNMT